MSKTPGPAEIEVDEITLEGRRIRVTNRELPVDDLLLDPSNPRVANTFAIESKGGKNIQERLEERLWADPDVPDLLRQVQANGGLIERIIVRSDMTVVEGNCRTVVYRKLRARDSRKLWERIPARVLPPDISPRDTAILLGEMHVAGKNTWSPFEKAGHVHRLHKEHMLSQDEIAAKLRMSKSKIVQLIRAFEAMKSKYIPLYPQGIRKYSYFEELYRQPVLRDWAHEPANLDQFVKWVGEERLETGSQVRSLPHILKNSEAYQAFLDKGFEDAKKVLEAENPALTSPLFKQMVELTTMLEQARLDDVFRLRGEAGNSAKQIATNLHTALSRFLELSRL